MMGAYVGEFKDAGDVVKEFEAPAGALDGAEVLLAWYGFGSYDGDAFVLFEKDGKLFEVNGGHCSCSGLEGQWDPEETSWGAIALALRKGNKFSSNYSTDEDKARERLTELVDARVPAEPAPVREEEA